MSVSYNGEIKQFDKTGNVLEAIGVRTPSNQRCEDVKSTRNWKEDERSAFADGGLAMNSKSSYQQGRLFQRVSFGDKAIDASVTAGTWSQAQRTTR
ncbi:unnamed protein product [Durusdinium trenchii]|uniref:Uncharacterized protein n=1 Tax=Durusdinium trenchii TaxID=1381693 RepID=A0ABP0N9H2_9DINO